MLEEPLRAVEATRLVREIVENGTIVYSGHSRDRMDENDMIDNDVVNVLSGGRIVNEAEWENGSWRYRVQTGRFEVVAAFIDEERLVVATVMRYDR